MPVRGRRTSPVLPDGAELGRLVLRVAVGGTLIAHGVKHGASLAGTSRWFESIGFKKPRLQAQLSSAVEIGAGTALLAGIATPLAASAAVGTMSVAYKTVHQPNGYFITNEGWEYVGFVSAAAIALAALGGGRYSIDRWLGLDVIGRPGLRALLAVGLGVGGAAGQLAVFWRKPAPGP